MRRISRIALPTAAAAVATAGAGFVFQGRRHYIIYVYIYIIKTWRPRGKEIRVIQLLYYTLQAIATKSATAMVITLVWITVQNWWRWWVVSCTRLLYIARQRAPCHRRRRRRHCVREPETSSFCGPTKRVGGGCTSTYTSTTPSRPHPVVRRDDRCCSRRGKNIRKLD